MKTQPQHVEGDGMAMSQSTARAFTSVHWGQEEYRQPWPRYNPHSDFRSPILIAGDSIRPSWPLFLGFKVYKKSPKCSIAALEISALGVIELILEEVVHVIWRHVLRLLQQVHSGRAMQGCEERALEG